MIQHFTVFFRKLERLTLVKKLEHRIKHCEEIFLQLIIICLICPKELSLFNLMGLINIFKEAKKFGAYEKS
jgi:hypothetical protein